MTGDIEHCTRRTAPRDHVHVFSTVHCALSWHVRSIAYPRIYVCLHVLQQLREVDTQLLQFSSKDQMCCRRDQFHIHELCDVRLDLVCKVQDTVALIVEVYATQSDENCCQLQLYIAGIKLTVSNWVPRASWAPPERPNSSHHWSPKCYVTWRNSGWVCDELQ